MTLEQKTMKYWAYVVFGMFVIRDFHSLDGLRIFDTQLSGIDSEFSKFISVRSVSAGGRSSES